MNRCFGLRLGTRGLASPHWLGDAYLRNVPWLLWFCIHNQTAILVTAQWPNRSTHTPSNYCCCCGPRIGPWTTALRRPLWSTLTTQRTR